MTGRQRRGTMMRRGCWFGMMQAGEGRTTQDRDWMETRDIYKAVERKGRKRRRRVKGLFEIWLEGGKRKSEARHKQASGFGSPLALPWPRMQPRRTATSDISSLKSPIAVYPDLIIENIPMVVYPSLSNEPWHLGVDLVILVPSPSPHPLPITSSSPELFKLTFP